MTDTEEQEESHPITRREFAARLGNALGIGLLLGETEGQVIEKAI